MEILQIGVNLQRQFPGSIRSQPPLNAFFKLVYPPQIELSFKNIQYFINSPFVLKAKQATKTKGEGSPLILKGSLVILF